MLLHTRLATCLLVFSMIAPNAVAKIYPDDFVNPSRDPADWSHDAEPGSFVEPIDWEGTGSTPVFIPAPGGDNESLYWPSALPEGTVTRGEFVTAIVSRLYTADVIGDCYERLSSSPEVTFTHLFRDVPIESVDGPVICTAMRSGMVRGMRNGTFAPGRLLTKAEAVTMMVRLSPSMFKKLRLVRPGEAWYAPSWELFVQSMPSARTMRPSDALTGAELRAWICAFSDSDITLDPFMECSK